MLFYCSFWAFKKKFCGSNIKNAFLNHIRKIQSDKENKCFEIHAIYKINKFEHHIGDTDRVRGLLVYTSIG